MTKTTRLALLSFAALALIYGFLTIAVPACLDHYAACLGGDVHITVISYRFRVLQPVIIAIFAPDSTDKSVLAVNLIAEILLAPLIIVGLYKWLRRWTSEDRAFIGVLVFTGVYLLAYPLYMMSLNTTIEVTCAIWALVFIDRFWVVGLLTIIASLNRETGLVIPALYLLYNWKGLDDYLNWLSGLTLLAYSGLITAAIHIALGGGDSTLGFGGTLAYNVSNLSDAIGIAMLLCPLVIVLALSFKGAPSVLKRLAIVALIYCGAVIGGAAWNETLRLCLPVLAIVLPMMVYQPVEVVKPSPATITFPEPLPKGTVVHVTYPMNLEDFE